MPPLRPLFVGPRSPSPLSPAFQAALAGHQSSLPFGKATARSFRLICSRSEDYPAHLISFAVGARPGSDGALSHPEVAVLSHGCLLRFVPLDVFRRTLRAGSFGHSWDQFRGPVGDGGRDLLLCGYGLGWDEGERLLQSGDRGGSLKTA